MARVLATVGFLALMLPSCREKITYPIVPHIEFKDFTMLLGADSTIEKGVLTLSFTDGDGDLGEKSEEGTNLSPPPFNLFIDYFELQEGVWKQLVNAEGDTLVLHGTLPYLTPQGKNKNISGIIEDTLFINPQHGHDTFRYEIYIRDRALHESNTVVTPIFVKPQW